MEKTLYQIIIDTIQDSERFIVVDSAYLDNVHERLYGFEHEQVYNASEIIIGMKGSVEEKIVSPPSIKKALTKIFSRKPKQNVTGITVKLFEEYIKDSGFGILPSYEKNSKYVFFDRTRDDRVERVYVTETPKYLNVIRRALEKSDTSL